MQGVAIDASLSRFGPVPSQAAKKRSFSLSQKARATLWLTLAFWISNFGVMTLAAVLAGRDRLLAVIGMRALLVLLGLFLCYLLYVALQKLSARSFKKRALAAAILAPVTAEGYAWVCYFGFLAIDPSLPPGNWGDAITYVASWTWFYLAWAGLSLALDYSVEVKEEQQRSAELQELAHRAKLQALQNQVSPHFFFNSLNSMSALILEGRIGDADKMIARLAAFFRTTLAADPLADSYLEEEIALQRAYLEIEQIRYPDLQVTVDLPKFLARASVPTLILQPIVENAVKHGVGASAPPARISIRADKIGDDLLIEIRDSCGPSKYRKPSAGAGIGLNNVRERLAQRFGTRFRFEATPAEPSGFRVTIQMPLVLP